MIFYPGLHQPSDAKQLPRAFISVKRLCESRREGPRARSQPLACPEWILDSGAFSELALFGKYRDGVAGYAAQIEWLAAINPGLRAAVAQDYMCEPMMIERTGLSVVEHQRRTIARYDELRALVTSVYIMPVLQGYFVHEYLAHVDQYGDRLSAGMLVGVGSVCKRNGSVAQVESILTALAIERPDLRLHGFGLKLTALRSGLVRRCLYSADSMAWSYAARRQGRDRNDWREAAAFARSIETQEVQEWLF